MTARGRRHPPLLSSRVCKARSSPSPVGGKAERPRGTEGLERKLREQVKGWRGRKRTIYRRVSEGSDGEAAAQRERWRPSFLMRDSRVVGLRPRSAAAPAGPRMRQLVCSSAARIWVRSVAARVGGAAAGGTAAAQRHLVPQRR